MRAGIVLPDHPRISEHSQGNLFDNTEIEEALVLHVHTLTDAERESAAAQDRVVGEMLERALALGPQEIMGLHSGLTDVEPEVLRTRGASEVRGEQHAILDGVRYERGDTIVLRPGTERDPFDRMLDGRRATGVEYAHWLFSTINTIGARCIAANINPSWNAPVDAPPSPKVSNAGVNRNLRRELYRSSLPKCPAISKSIPPVRAARPCRQSPGSCNARPS